MFSVWTSTCFLCDISLAPSAAHWVCRNTHVLCRDHYVVFAEWLEQEAAMGEILIAWRAAVQTVSATVHSLAGEVLAKIVVKKTTTIREVKEKIAESRGGLERWRVYQLVYGIQLLENGRTLVQCGYNGDHVLSLFVHGDGAESSTDESAPGLVCTSSDVGNLGTMSPSSCSSSDAGIWERCLFPRGLAIRQSRRAWCSLEMFKRID